MRKHPTSGLLTFEWADLSAQVTADIEAEFLLDSPLVKEIVKKITHGRAERFEIIDGVVTDFAGARLTELVLTQWRRSLVN